MNVINCFDGQYAFLSNFYETKLYYNGIVYPHSESAFQAAKSLDERVRKEFALIMKTPGQAKRAGKGKPFTASNGDKLKIELRPDWEVVKDNIMDEIVRAKFTQNQALKQALLMTGDAELVEGNYWHDNYWGICSCERCANKTGRNQLGKTLMKIRAEFKAEEGIISGNNPNGLMNTEGGLGNHLARMIVPDKDSMDRLVCTKGELMDLLVSMAAPDKDSHTVVMEYPPELNLTTKAPYQKMPSLPAGVLDGPLKPPCSKC